MWIINEDGDAINLSKTFMLSHHEGKVFAEFKAMVLEEKDDDDEYFMLSDIPLKTFKNKSDAKKYIAELVEKLNGEKI